MESKPSINSGQCPVEIEMSLEGKPRTLEEQLLIADERCAALNKSSACPKLKALKDKAFEDNTAHRKSVELDIESSQKFIERKELSLQNIESGMERVETKMAELRKIIERQESTSENEFSIPGMDSCGYPCMANQIWVVIGLLSALLIVDLIRLIRSW